MVINNIIVIIKPKVVSMFTDSHCHLNIITKEKFDVALSENDFNLMPAIVERAQAKQVTKIINVATSLIESINSIEIAKRFEPVWATVGIHPNDLTQDWPAEIKQLKKYLDHKAENKIVAIGECGMDFYYEGYDLQRQKDGFRAQIELALHYNLPICVHTRVAPQETLRILDEYIKNNLTGVIHCFSEDLSFAKQVIDWGFVLGLGGIITYPKNTYLRDIVTQISLNDFILETDAPFLPIQTMRGKTNYPEYIYDIASYIADLKNCSLDQLAQATDANVKKIFQI